MITSSWGCSPTWKVLHEPSEARYDPDLGAWVLSRYADVATVLRDPRVSVQGGNTSDDAAHLTVRAATAHALSPQRLETWRADLEADACRLVESLPVGQPVDLVQSFAEPWSLAVALRATGAPGAIAAECARAARLVFLSSACATDGVPRAPARDAAAHLGRLLTSAGPRLDASADVQTFVALSQTLPCLLSGAWLALLQHPEQVAQLRADATLVTQVVGELLRFAGPARAVFREALADVAIGGARIRSGDRIVLMLSAANRDPRRFPQPDRLDLRRATASHLAFGAGPHGCAGATLVRMAVGVATCVLLGGTAAMELVEGGVAPVEWIGGFATRAPRTLPVVLRRTITP